MGMVSPKLPYMALKLLIAIEGQSPAVVQWIQKGGELYGLQNRDYLREMQVQGRTIPIYVDGIKRIHLPKLQGAYAGRLLDAFEKRHRCVINGPKQLRRFLNLRF